MYDVLILGAGPAGLGAAIYAARAGLSLAVIDQSPISGGQVLNTYEVDNYLGLMGETGGGLSDKFRAHADKLGTEFITDEVKSVEDLGDKKVVRGYERDYEARALILATGAAHSKLGIPGEDRLSGMGVSYCATCDGAFFKNRITAVVGGGDVAVEDALFLSNICKKVYLIHRRDSLRAVKACRNAFLQKKMWRYYGTARSPKLSEKMQSKKLPFIIRRNSSRQKWKSTEFSLRWALCRTPVCSKTL